MAQRQEVDERRELFRFDVEFNGWQPPLEEVSHTDETARLGRLGLPMVPATASAGSRVDCELGTAGLAAFMGQLHRSGAFFRCHCRSLPSSFHCREGGGVAPGDFC